MQIALVNTNLIKPPIAPIGLEYVAEAVHAAGHDVKILDLSWEKDVERAIADFFSESDAALIGITLRNTDDCAFTTRMSFLLPFSKIVQNIRKHSDALIVLGGVGFSVMPQKVLELTYADCGIWGEGEFTFIELVDRVSKRESWTDLRNLVWKKEGHWIRNPVQFGDLKYLPAMHRQFFDNKRYFCEGGQAGFETKRGCPGQCTYCADPLAKGKKSRMRPPGAVVDELVYLLRQGIDYFHTCDSEFNIPEIHALEICEKIIQKGLGSKIRWYAYCNPMPFTRKLAKKMRQAGCVGINFGVDHGDPVILKKLKRSYGPEDILNISRWCKESDIAVMFDLLIGSPGETKTSIQSTIELMQKCDAERIGIALGLRVWPGTELAREVLNSSDMRGLSGGKDPTRPLFFLEPGIEDKVAAWLDQWVGDDRRFLFFNPAQSGQNYNYNANQVLVNAIKEGHRGAYWDILRRIN